MSKSAQPESNLLQGVRVLVGRARHQASILSAGLKRLGAEVIEIPFIEIRPARSYKAFDAALKNVADYDWLILTSVNGVEALTTRLKRVKTSPEALRHLKIAAIGPATREAVEKLGRVVSIVPRQYVAESVVESLRTQVNGKRVLLARARVARDVIPRELRGLGAHVDVVEAYETVVPASSRKKLGTVIRDAKRRPNVVTFTSSSTVRNFVRLLGGPVAARSFIQGRRGQSDRGEIRLASIGPVTSATLRELGLPVHIEAEEYTIPGLINAIVGALGK